MNWRYLLLVPVVTILVLYIGKYVTTAPLTLALSLLAVIVGLVAFLNPSNGLLIIVFSMLLSPEISIGKVPGRDIGLRVDDLLVIAVFIAWLTHISLDKNWKGFIRTPFNNLLMFMTFLYIVSTGIGIITGNVKPVTGFFYGLKYIEYLFIYWMASNIITSKEEVVKYLYAGLATFIIVMIYAYTLMGTTDRVYAPFDSQAGGEPATLGGYYLIVYGVLFSFMLHARTSLGRVAFLALILISLPTFMKTLSRASFLGFVPMVLALLLLTRRRKLFFGLILLAGALLIPILFQNFYTETVDRIKYTFTGAHLPAYQSLKVGGATIEDQSALERVISWKRTVNVYFLKNPLTMMIGNGITGIRFTEGQFFLLLGELGLLGLITFYWLQLKIFATSYRLYKSSDDHVTQSLSLGLVAALIGLTFQSLTTNTFIIVRIMEPFWMLTAMVALLSEQNAEAGAEPNRFPDKPITLAAR